MKEGMRTSVEAILLVSALLVAKLICAMFHYVEIPAKRATWLCDGPFELIFQGYKYEHTSICISACMFWSHCNDSLI